MDSFAHVIVTRFNIATQWRDSAIRNDPVWLRERFDLFKEWCLPAIAVQSERAFRWLLLFDHETPAPFRAELEDLRAVHPFDVHYTGPFDADGWRRSIEEAIAPQAPLILTTRLDNDDALEATFVERLHAAVRGAEEGLPKAFNFPDGLIRQGDGLWRIRHEHNAVFSLLEHWGGPVTTAYGIAHMELPRRVPIVQVDGPPGWLQVVHGGNVSNKVRGRRAGIDGTARFGGRGLDGVRAPTLGQRAAEGVLTPLRDARDAGAGLLRRLRALRS